MIRKPKNNEKIFYLEQLLHQLSAYYQMGNQEKIKKILDRVDQWSYAHRSGNGTLTDQQQQRLVNRKFWTCIANINSDSFDEL